MKDEWDEFQNSKKKDSMSFITVAIIVALIVVVGALIAWLYIRNRNNTETDIQQTTQLESTEQQAGTENIDPELNNLESKDTEKSDFDRFLEFIPSGIVEDYLNHSSKQYNVKMFRQGIKYFFEGSFLTEVNETGGSWEKWDEQKKKMINLGRRVLSEPENLKKVYELNKPILVAGIKAAKKEKSVVRQLNHASLIFDKKMSEKEIALFENYYKVDTLLYNEINSHSYEKERILQLTNQLDGIFQKLRDRKFTEDSIYFYEFSQRREKEGGKELLEGYLYVFNDLVDALK